MLKLVVLGASAVLASSDCNSTNKEKAMYADPSFDPPLSEVGAFDVEMDVIWTNLDGLRAFGADGVFAAFPVHWHGSPSIGGYVGPQATGDDAERGPALFSLWDGAYNTSEWQPALPLSEGCRRNCEDCDDPNVTTGTQCSVSVPAYSGARLRLRLRRVRENVTADYAGRSWTGDQWECTIAELVGEALRVNQTWLVGEILLTFAAGGAGGGLESVSSFDEHIGCVPCGAFDVAETRAGPWVREPAGTALVAVSSTYSGAGATCRDHSVDAAEGTSEPAWRFASGPAVDDHPDWDKVLFVCNDTVHDCASPPSGVPADGRRGPVPRALGGAFY